MGLFFCIFVHFFCCFGFSGGGVVFVFLCWYYCMYLLWLGVVIIVLGHVMRFGLLYFCLDMG